MKIVIVGCGIGGAALALGLQRLGVDYVLLEQADALREVGAGLQLSPNGVKVLEHLGVAGRVREAAVEPTDLLYRDWASGEIILRQPLMPKIESVYGAPFLHAHRADLLAALTDGLDHERILLGQRVKAVRQREDKVIAETEDGTLVTGDLLVAADGIHSGIRRQLFRADAPEASGCLAWRGSVAAAQAKDLDVARASHLWMGPGQSAALYYVSRGEQINWICFDDAPREMEESWSRRGEVEQLLADFEGWNPAIRELIRRSGAPLVTAIYDRQPLDGWVKGRIALLGDAAHAMLPYHAQGAVQSLEDAWVLARLISDSATDGMTGALEHYQRLRIERTRRLQEHSRAAERRIHLRDPAEMTARNDKLRDYGRRYGEDYFPQQDWLFGYDAELAAQGEDHAWRALRAW